MHKLNMIENYYTCISVASTTHCSKIYLNINETGVKHTYLYLSLLSLGVNSIRQMGLYGSLEESSISSGARMVGTIREDF